MEEHPTTAWWEEYEHTIPTGLFAFIRDESAATAIACFQAAVIPGLLQTERYAQGVVSAFGRASLSPRQCQQRVKLRMQRQWQILERATPPSLHVVIEEAVLWRIVTNREVQYEQLVHLQRMAELPHITIQILPLHSGLIWEIFDHTPIDIFTFPPPRLAIFYRDGRLDHEPSTSSFEVDYYRTTFQRTSEQALSPRESIKLIQTVANKIRQPRTVDLVAL